MDAVGSLGDDPDVDAIILTGADPAFCAGVDLKEVSGEAPPTTAPRGRARVPSATATGSTGSSPWSPSR